MRAARILNFDPCCPGPKHLFRGFFWDIQPLFSTIRSTPSQGTIQLDLQRTSRRAARSVSLSVCFTQRWLRPPAHLGHLPAIAVWVILAEEDAPPKDEPPVCWFLLTTIAVSDFATAQQCLIFYSFRWLIERYHFTLKSGCRLEALQLKQADRLHRALATYAIVAWRLLWLTYEARRHQGRSVEGILETAEWQALYCTVHQTTSLPPNPPTLGECIRWIAGLGGFLGRKGDGDPGICTLWRGLQRLYDIAATWSLLQG